MKNNELQMHHVNALEDLVASDTYGWGINIAIDAMSIIEARLCTSKNHHTCYGPLWECSECKCIFCCVEGSDDCKLCDTCWTE